MIEVHAKVQSLIHTCTFDPTAITNDRNDELGALLGSSLQPVFVVCSRFGRFEHACVNQAYVLASKINKERGCYTAATNLSEALRETRRLYCKSS